MTETLIADSIYAACDDFGNEYPMMDSIVDYRKSNNAISFSIQKVVHRGRNKMWRSRVRWQICVKWRYGSTSWQYLKNLKESHPVETAEYAVAQEIDHELAFNWWVNTILNNRLRIISLVRKRNAQYIKKTHKLGILYPIQLIRHMLWIRIMEITLG